MRGRWLPMTAIQVARGLMREAQVERLVHRLRAFYPKVDTLVTRDALESVRGAQAVLRKVLHVARSGHRCVVGLRSGRCAGAPAGVSRGKRHRMRRPRGADS